MTEGYEGELKGRSDHISSYTCMSLKIHGIEEVFKLYCNSQSNKPLGCLAFTLRVTAPRLDVDDRDSEVERSEERKEWRSRNI